MRRTVGPGGSEASPLPRREPRPVPPAAHPVSYVDDPELLTRVAERLRAREALDALRLAGLRRLN